MSIAPPHAGSLTALLHERARHDPDRLALRALDVQGDTVATLTNGELDAAARALAAELREHAAPGERVLLPPMPGLRFHVAFLACLYAGLIAVPVPQVPAKTGRSATARLTRLLGVCADAGPTLIVVPEDLVAGIAEVWAGHEVLAAIRVIPARDRPGDGPPPVVVDLDAVAFLQYTSGSTSAPRGVMISHRAIMANQRSVVERSGVHAGSTMVSWIPTYHDMGLCLGLLMPVYAGVPAIVLEPDSFLLRPEVWLHAISGIPDACSAAPDFAYAWCARRVKNAAKAGLDLSGWHVTISGAEPVNPRTVRDFHAAFAANGLSDRTVSPCYGLAEATVFVTGTAWDAEPLIRGYDRVALADGRAVPDPTGMDLVGCGAPGLDIEVAVVDPQTARRRPDRLIGEVWVRSPALGLGYWNRPEESRATFSATLDGEPGQTWLRTGDLGFLDGGELFVTGRHKDLIIIAGANYYPQDLEQLAQQAHPLLDGGLAAAVAVAGENRVTILVEAVRRPDGDEAAVAAAAALRAVTAVLPVAADVAITNRGQLPRTTSGKVRRAECATRLRDGQIAVIAQWPRIFTPASDKEYRP